MGMISLCLVLIFSRFINGHPAEKVVVDDDEFQFQVTVKDLFRNVSLCSGMLITTKAVVTSARCVEADVMVKVSAGSNRRSKQNKTITSTEVIISNQYGRNDSSYGIALIRVGDPFPLGNGIEMSKVPVEGVPLVPSGSLTGWNAVDFRDELGVVQDYALRKDCEQKYNLSAGPDEFCGDYTIGATTGYIVSKNDVVYGLLTETLPELKTQKFTEISRYAKWIKKNLGQEAEEVAWYDVERNQASTPSNCVAAMLLFAVFLCQ